MGADGVAVTIRSFEPLTVEFPRGPIVGRVTIVLPPVHLRLYDLSMGLDLLAGAHIGGDAPVVGLTFSTGPEGITPGKLADFISTAQADLRRVWQSYQDELDRRPALCGGV